MDAVQKVGNGHPGTAMSLAPAAHLLFSRFLRHDPGDPQWLGRDRFVLSCGHSSLTLYIQLFLCGYGLELSDLESFRTWGSLTPGHPEHGHTVGVETTTGPLGQGISTAVGMAMASRFERGMLDPDAPWGTSPFDHHVWVIASDGDLEEGVSAEASSLAAVQRLANLTVIWDDNHISIEGNTDVAFTEDVAARYEAYGWRVHEVGLTPTGDIDVDALADALDAARYEAERPTFIAMRSVIAWPAPHAQNTAKAHGAALGAEEVAATKKRLGLDPEQDFAVPQDVLAHTRAVGERNRPLREDWQERFDSWRESHPDGAALLDRLLAAELPADLDAALPAFDTGASLATRQASGKAINALAAVLPELWGGSADLAGSNDTTINGGLSFLPAGTLAPDASPYGRILHFGIREHAMGAILNGISLSGLTRPFGGTFLVFSDYMRGAVRLSALMQTPVTYVWTHDSIGLGEDGPTHQPVEHLWSLRAIPGFAVVRPADARETAVAWLATLQQRGPVGLILSRQGLPVLEGTEELDAATLSRGAYTIADSGDGTPDAIIIATGSEVSLALQAQERLAVEGIHARVVSAPCLEWFDAQDEDYRRTVLPPSCRARVSVEAGATLGWFKYVGDAGETVGLDHFGASADAATLYREFGITPDTIADAVRRSVQRSAKS
jgi:transketolase